VACPDKPPGAPVLPGESTPLADLKPGRTCGWFSDTNVRRRSHHRREASWLGWVTAPRWAPRARRRPAPRFVLLRARCGHTVHHPGGCRPRPLASSDVGLRVSLDVERPRPTPSPRTVTNEQEVRGPATSADGGGADPIGAIVRAVNNADLRARRTVPELAACPLLAGLLSPCPRSAPRRFGTGASGPRHRDRCAAGRRPKALDRAAVLPAACFSGPRGQKGRKNKKNKKKTKIKKGRGCAAETVPSRVRTCSRRRATSPLEERRPLFAAFLFPASNGQVACTSTPASTAHWQLPRFRSGRPRGPVLSATPAVADQPWNRPAGVACEWSGKHAQPRRNPHVPYTGPARLARQWSTTVPAVR